MNDLRALVLNAGPIPIAKEVLHRATEHTLFFTQVHDDRANDDVDGVVVAEDRDPRPDR